MGKYFNNFNNNNFYKMGKSDKPSTYENINGNYAVYKNGNFSNISGISATFNTLNSMNASFDTIYAKSIHGNFVDDFENITGTSMLYTNANITNKLTLGDGNEGSPIVSFNDNKNGLFFNSTNNVLNFKIDNNSNHYISNKVSSFDSILQTRSIRQSVLTVTSQNYTITQEDVDNYGIIFFDGQPNDSTIKVYLPKFTNESYVGNRIVLINSRSRDSVKLEVNRQPGDYFNGSNNTVMVFSNKYVIEIFVGKIEPSTYNAHYFSI